MKASLIFSSTSHSINVQKVRCNCPYPILLGIFQKFDETRADPLQIFKIVLAKAFDLKCTIPEIENVGEPLLLYKNV